MTGSGFLLGTHQPSWLAHLTVPLLVSHRTFRARRRLSRARVRCALDSGGFTELRLFGGWQTSPAAYIEAVARYQAEIGPPSPGPAARTGGASRPCSPPPAAPWPTTSP